MQNKVNILAICGSTRQQSANHLLIEAIGRLSEERFSIQLFDDLTGIPHFNPDLDLPDSAAPAAVERFRQRLKSADGVLICTPEYAIGVPGTLKNAIDWTVSSMSLSGKPVALITASTSGFKAHASLLGTLLIVESKIAPNAQLVIPSIKTKLTTRGEIIDGETLDRVHSLIDALFAAATGGEQPYLVSPGMN